VREYAVERLAAAGELDDVAGRHAAYYLDLVERAVPHLARHEQLVWLALLDAEQGNLRAALGHYLEKADVEEGLHLATSLGWRMLQRGEMVR
jgi:predicted ATPase